MVWLEAVSGQFYMAVFVARLIGLQSSTTAAAEAEPAPLVIESRRAA